MTTSANLSPIYRATAQVDLRRDGSSSVQLDIALHAAVPVESSIEPTSYGSYARVQPQSEEIT